MKRARHFLVAVMALVFAASCGGSSTAVPASVNLTGTWELSELITEASGICAGNIGDTTTYTIEVVQNGNDITVTVGDDAPENAGAVFTGTVSGDRIDWSGSYATGYGTTDVTSTDITATNAEFNGTANWNWSGDGDSCSGKTQVTGYKI